MLFEETALDLLNRLFEEAVRLHGGDSKKVARHVREQIAALGPGERVAVDGAVERLLAFRAPDSRPGPPN
jgi:hypothetical protein